MKKAIFFLLVLVMSFSVVFASGDTDSAAAEGSDSVELVKDLPVMKMIVSSREQDKILGEYLQDVMNKEFGIELDVQVFEKKYDEFKAMKFEIGYAGWGPDYNDPETYLHMWHTGDYTSTYVGWEDTDFDKIMNEAAVLPDGLARAEKLVEAEKYLLSKGPIVPLFQRGGAYALADDVEGFYKNFVGTENDYIYASTSDGTFIAAYDVDPDSLDPQQSNSNWTTIVTAGMYEGLFRFNNGEYKPGMATDYSISDDGLVYTFNIRKGVTWNNGDPINAQTFVDTFRLLQTRPAAAAYTGIAGTIVNSAEVAKGELPAEELGVKAVSEYVFEITLATPTPYLVSLLSSLATFYPVNKAVFEEYGDNFGTTPESITGNGPFTLVEAETQNYYRLIKNENYWDKDSINLDEVIIYIIPDENTQVNMFESGELSFIDVPVDSAEAYISSGKALVFDAGSSYYFKFCYGEGSSPEANALATNRNFINAVSHLIDREALVSAVFGELSTYKAAGNFVVHSVTAADGVKYGELIEGFDFGHPLTADVDEAKRLFNLALKELGYIE